MMSDPEADAAPDADHPGAKHTPTPEEIRRMCEIIQAEWTPAEELRRRAVQPSRELDYGRRVVIGE